jgi:small subunit ribosomal protein S29
VYSCQDTQVINTVNSTTSLAYDARSQTYFQPTYAHQTLQRSLTVNSSQLQTLKTQEIIFLDKRPPLPEGTPLTELAAVGMKDASIAPAVLSALFQQLGKQTQ